MWGRSEKLEEVLLPQQKKNNAQLYEGATEFPLKSIVSRKVRFSKDSTYYNKHYFCVFPKEFIKIVQIKYLQKLPRDFPQWQKNISSFLYFLLSLAPKIYKKSQSVND